MGFAIIAGTAQFGSWESITILDSGKCVVLGEKVE